MDHLGAARLQRVHTQARTVNGNGVALVAEMTDNAGNPGIGRIFHGQGFFPAEQEQKPPVGKFRAGSHEDLVRVHLHAPVVLEIVGQGCPEFVDAVVGNHAVQRILVAVQRFPCQAGPRGSRKKACAVAVGTEVHFVFFPRRAGKDTAGSFRFHAEIRYILYEKAPFFDTADIPFHGKLRIRVGDRHDADVQMLRQGPFGRQFPVPRQAAGNDVLPDALVEIFVQGHSPPLGQIIRKHENTPCLYYTVFRAGMATAGTGSIRQKQRETGGRNTGRKTVL
jgi:hypothetical protein